MKLPFCLLALALVLSRGVAAGTNDIYVVPFSHLDLMWGGTFEECLSRGGRIISKAVQVAQRHPEFRFLIEDEVFAANFVDAHRGSPDVDQLKHLVKEGRIAVAPKWAAIYENLPRGETLVRNLIYGKQYAREVFGVDPQVGNLTDIPGFTQQLPQIFINAEIPFLVMTRICPPDTSLFSYRSPDGTTALVWNTIKGYGWGVGLGLHHTTNFDHTHITNIEHSVGQIQGTTRGPIYLSWGTDLFAPGDSLITNLQTLNKELAPLKFSFATPEEFFHAATNVANVPELSGEIPFAWGSLITAMSHLWPPAVKASDTLLTAEKFSAINFALGCADYPQQEFERLWKLTLQASDHNSFGQGGLLGDERKLGFAQTVSLRAGEILRNMLRNLAERVERPFPRSTPIVVFNPMSWQRDDIVSTHVSLYGDVGPGDIGDYYKAMRLVDETGASVPFHIIQSHGMVSRAYDIVFLASGVPSLGYKTYFIVPADKPDVFPAACEVKLDQPDPKSPKRVTGSDQFENQFYRVSVDRITGRITIFDKDIRQVIAKDMEIVGLEERGGSSITTGPATGRTILNAITKIEIEETNSVRAVVRIDGDLGGVPITQRLFLYGGAKRVELENTVDWNNQRFLRIEQLFPYDHPGAQIRYGIPFGSAAGADIMPKSGPRGGDEISKEEWDHWRQIQDWMFVGTEEWGATISSDRALMILGDNVIRAPLLRSTYSTCVFSRGGKPAYIPVPPAQKYVFHYSITSGRGDWLTNRSYRTGMSFAAPLIPISAVDELSSKSLPPTHSFVSLAAPSLAVTALKKAERDNAIVLRLVEMEGTAASTPVEFLGSKRRARPINLLEAEAQSGEPDLLEVKPYAIRTVRLLLK